MKFSAGISRATAFLVAMALAAGPATAAPAKPAKVSLATDIKTATNVCGTAYSVRDLQQTNTLSTTGIADGAWHYYEYKRTGPASLTMDQVVEWSYHVPDNAAGLRTNVDGFIAACQKRWPKSARSYPVKLPTKAWDRALLCHSLATNMGGFITVKDVIDPDNMAAKVSAVKGWAGKIVHDASLKAYGFETDAKVNAAMEKAYVGAVTLGNLNSVLAACAAVK